MGWGACVNRVCARGTWYEPSKGALVWKELIIFSLELLTAVVLVQMRRNGGHYRRASLIRAVLQ